MTRFVDLNADLGEGMPWDFELLARVSSASLSCGAHAGSPREIASTLAEASRLGVIVGAHPGWPDRPGFGRVERSATRSEVERLVLDQLQVLRLLAVPLGVAVRYVKPHGALYNQAMREDDASEPIILGLLDAIRESGLPLMGQPQTSIERIGANSGIPYVREGFPDRRYRSDGRLVPRTEPNAMMLTLEDVAAQALRLVDEGIESLCIHGDSPEAIARADAIRAGLDREGIVVRSFLTAFSG